jgi:hypothetical protein
MNEEDMDYEDHGSTFQDEVVETEERPKKRSKRTHKKGKNNLKGSKSESGPVKRKKSMIRKLKALPELPIDILHQVRHNFFFFKGALSKT